MRKINLLCLWVLGMFCTVASAQVTLEQCSKSAREHYPLIAMYDIIAASEKYTLDNARLQWLPQGGIVMQTSYQSDVPNLESIDEFKTWSDLKELLELERYNMSKLHGQLGIEIRQNIWDGGKSASDAQIAREEANVKRKEMENDLYSLEERVEQTFFGILMLNENIQLTKSKIELLRSNLKDMETYVANGVAMQMNVDMLKAECLTAEQLYDNLQTRRRSYLSVLELLTGLELDGKELVRPRLIESTNLSINPMHPQLSLFEQYKNELRAQESKIKVSVMPTISAFVQGWYGYPGLDTFKSIENHNLNLNAIVGLKLNWSFSALYYRSNMRKKIQSSIDSYDVMRDVFVFNTNLANKELKWKIDELQQMLKKDTQIAELRHSVRMAMEARLQQGYVDATTLLQKIAEENQALITRSTHELELLQTQYKISHNTYSK